MNKSLIRRCQDIGAVRIGWVTVRWSEDCPTVGSTTSAKPQGTPPNSPLGLATNSPVGYTVLDAGNDIHERLSVDQVTDRRRSCY